MDKNYFQIIELMIKNRYVSQREIAAVLKISAAYVNKIIARYGASAAFASL